MKNFKVRMAGKGTGEIIVYDEITPRGWGGVDAKSFMDEVKALGKVDTLNVRLNSIGGDVFEGVAIYNFLNRVDARIVVDVDAQALSIASVIAMAGDEIRIAENARIMIHDPWTIAGGTAEDLRKKALIMDDTKENMVGIYAARTGLPADEIAAMMAAETWFTASEAVSSGFANSVTENLRIAASGDPSRFKNAPQSTAREEQLIANPHRARLADIQRRAKSYGARP